MSAKYFVAALIPWAALCTWGTSHAQSYSEDGFVVYADGKTWMNPPYYSPIKLRDGPGGATTTVIRDRGDSLRYVLEDHSSLDVRGGTLRAEFDAVVELKENSRLTMSSGTLGQYGLAAALYAASGSPEIEISGGRIASWYSNEGFSFPGTGIGIGGMSQLNITGGTFEGMSRPLVTFGQSTAALRGGTFHATYDRIFAPNGVVVSAEESSRIEIFGGSFKGDALGIRSIDSATISIYGGQFDFLSTPSDRTGGLKALDDSRIFVHGANFALNGVPVPYGTIPHSGLVTGTLLDGGQVSFYVDGRVILAAAPPPFAADFDGDADVDGADFLSWQRGFGSQFQIDQTNGDADGDGDVDRNDLTRWISDFGRLGPTLQAVPEPSASLLLLATAGFLLRPRFR